MTTTMSVRKSVAEALDAGVRVRDRGDTQLVCLPLALSDGHLVQVAATRVDGDVWALSDRGQAAMALWDEGIDLSSGVPARSWDALLRAIDLPPAMGAPEDEYILSMGSTSGSLGTDVLRLGEAILLADGLRALKRPPQRSRIARRIIAAAQEVPDVAILPNAKMPTRFGANRTVTVKLSNARTQRELFTQGVGGHKASSSYDHARALFADSNVPESQRVVIVGANASMEIWQRKALSTVARVVDEADMTEVFQRLLAA